MKHPRKRPSALAAAALLALTLAGCGEESGDPAANPSSSATSTDASSSESESSSGAGQAESEDESESGSQGESTGESGGEGDAAGQETASGSASPSRTGSSPKASSGTPTSNAPDPDVSVQAKDDPAQKTSERSTGTTAADGSAAATSLSIPAVDLRTSISPDGLRGGKVNPPPNKVTWFNGYDRVRPGAKGTSVIAGHVINKQGPDTFAALEQLETGDGVVLGYPGGEKLRLEVTSTDVVGKDELRTSADVWGSNSSTRRVVLITCDDQLGFRDDGHRKANFVAIAEVPS